MTKRTVLVVEDEPDVQRLIKRSLDMQNFKTLEADSGTQALALLKHHQPDFILLDIMMADMDGFEVCQRIKGLSQSQNIPVAFLTVRNGQEDILRARALGAVGYFTKPFDPFKLGEELEKLLS